MPVPESVNGYSFLPFESLVLYYIAQTVRLSPRRRRQRPSFSPISWVHMTRLRDEHTVKQTCQPVLLPQSDTVEQPRKVRKSARPRPTSTSTGIR
jgi:hypothetical protein